jgi:hypothetical protein
MTSLTPEIKPGHSGTRISVRLGLDTWSAPKPADLIAEITEAVALLMSNGVASDDTHIDVDLDCSDRDGHELRVTVYGYRPNTPSERAKITRERNAAKKKEAEWHRAQLERLERS